MSKSLKEILIPHYLKHNLEHIHIHLTELGIEYEDMPLPVTIA